MVNCIGALVRRRDGDTLDVCLAWDTCGDNGVFYDPLDVCLGDQLAGFVTLGTYA